MVKTLVNTMRIFICGVLTVQLMGCGTLMYPERRGQRGGRLDVGVTVLDAIGLLFFIIPGVIAFCIDFSNGTIYLPERGVHLSSLDLKNIRVVRFNPKYTSMASIERIIKDETGYEVKLNGENTKVAKLKSKDDMMEQFAQVSSGDNRIALNR